MIEAAVRAQILSTTNVTGLLASTNAVYHFRLPEGATLPAVTFHRISGATRHPDYAGVTNLVHSRIQVDCWATQGNDVADLAREVRVALNGYSGTSASVVVLGSFLIDEAMEYEVETQLYRQRHDYMISHQEVTT